MNLGKRKNNLSYFKPSLSDGLLQALIVKHRRRTNQSVHIGLTEIITLMIHKNKTNCDQSGFMLSNFQSSGWFLATLSCNVDQSLISLSKVWLRETISACCQFKLKLFIRVTANKQEVFH